MHIRAAIESAGGLVGRAEIAALAHVTPEAVSQWVRRDVGFPPPVARTTAGAVWLKAEVEAWLIRTGRANKVVDTADDDR